MEFPRPTPSSRPSAAAALAAMRHHRHGRRVLAVLLIAVTVLALRAQQRDATTAADAWRPLTATWVATADLEAGHLLAPDDVDRRLLPPGALPADAVVASPVGTRLADAVADDEVLRVGRLGSRGSSALGARIGPGRGAVSLTAPTPHLRLGDRVDLYEPFTGARVAADTEVVAVLADLAVLAVDDAALGDVIRAFQGGEVVPVLVG